MTDGEKTRDGLYRLLGDLPERDRPIACMTVEVKERRAYVLEKLLLDVNGQEPVAAWFLRPKQLERPAPAILYNHAHGSNYALGKDEFLRGRKELCSPPWAETLAALGFCGLCMDMWVFGERAVRSEMDTFKEMLWRGRVLWGMMVYDSLRGLDYLAGRPEVDAARLGTVGLSMGSTMAWWLAALDERVRVCVDICCLTDFDALIEAGHLAGHGIYYYVPALLKHFTTSEINAMIAPRAHLALAGERDLLTPPRGLDRIDGELRRAYAAAGRPEAWQLLRYPVAHRETPEMRQAAVEWLQRFL
jgi:hypothetical protein